MNTKQLANYFINHSPNFFKDIELDSIDKKHALILENSYESIEKDEAFAKNNFRNWKHQSDMGATAQFNFNTIGRKGRLKWLLRYLYRFFFKRMENNFLFSSMKDDIDIIEMIGANKLLEENPVHHTPYAGYFYEINSSTVNTRWLRYIYIVKRILDFDLPVEDFVWVDIGCYYGGLQGLVRKYCPDARIIMVDFHHQLCRSYIYLRLLHTDSIHIFPDQLNQYRSFQDMPEGAFVYVPVDDFDSISDMKADLATNFFGLGEMRKEYFNHYMSSQLLKNSTILYLVNRFVSSPFYEKTYDTDINIFDYDIDRKIKYFDVFPIHHYLLLNRDLFGRKQFRNTSSSYFEMITHKRTRND